ncbi:MAG: xanthine dehydrogenase family protein molybdopterin-binding subunit [Candidatus Lustribacter sp.]
MKHIGTSHPRHDALDKVTGAANYPADLIKPGMLRLKTVFARRAHARILSIDTSAALAVPGVVAVLTAKDVPHNRYGLIDADQPVLCDDTVRHDGDRVALVAAETDLAAARGAALVRVEYEDLPIVSDPRAAMQPGAQRVHHDRDNVLLHQKIRRGEVARAFDEADVIVEGSFTTQWQEHAYLQPDAGIAYFDQHGRIVIETAGQWLHEDRKQLAEILELPEDRVVVKYAKIGGAFGGREDMSVQGLVAVATWVLKRPAAIRWSREESIIGHHKRHPFFITARWGAKRDGTIVAVETTLIADGGAYASTSIEVLKGAMTFAHGPYDIPNVSVDGYACYTNNVPSGAFRGFGGPQAHFAAESMITRVAHALELDPLDVRRANLYREGSINSSGTAMPAGVSAIPVLERCIEEAAQRLAPVVHDAHSRKRRGIGYASGIKNVGYSFGFPDQATATVELVVLDGVRAARVRIGAADVGQGAHLILRQIAAETLSLPLEAVTIIAEDTADAPNAGSASASRMTLMGGRAVKDAAELALRNLATGAAPAATVQFRPSPTTPFDEMGRGTPHFAYGYVAQAVEVEVDVTTGEVAVLNVISVNDVGRAINRRQVEAQIEGCIAQAIGYALTEDFRIKDGRILTPHFSSYLLPTALDVPAEIVSIIMETPDPQGPFGARGMSEMPLVPFGAAVASAIHHATGAWVSDMPFTPERVLAAITASANREPAPVAGALL